jgi:flagellum-specific peptidoglycan hydrolase FlgJ
MKNILRVTKSIDKVARIYFKVVKSINDYARILIGNTNIIFGVVRIYSADAKSKSIKS